MEAKDAKQARALDGATEVFTRYGYARTTMGDIAVRSGLSRPALYLLFPDKEAAFARVIERMGERQMQEILAGVAGRTTLEEKLLLACLDWGLHGVELAAKHPDAADLFDLRFPAVRQVYARFEAFVAGLISGAVARSGLQATPAELARTLVYGMRGLRDAAADVEDMRRLVRLHVVTFAGALAAEAPAHAPAGAAAAETVGC